MRFPVLSPKVKGRVGHTTVSREWYRLGPPLHVFSPLFITITSSILLYYQKIHTNYAMVSKHFEYNVAYDVIRRYPIEAFEF